MKQSILDEMAQFRAMSNKKKKKGQSKTILTCDALIPEKQALH